MPRKKTSNKKKRKKKVSELEKFSNKVAKALVKHFGSGKNISKLDKDVLMNGNVLRVSTLQEHYNGIYKKSLHFFQGKSQVSDDKMFQMYNTFFQFLKETDDKIAQIISRTNRVHGHHDSKFEMDRGVERKRNEFKLPPHTIIDTNYIQSRNIQRFVDQKSSPFGLYYFEDILSFQKLSHTKRNMYHITTVYRVIVKELWPNKSDQVDYIMNPFASQIKKITATRVACIIKHYKVYKTIKQSETYNQKYHQHYDLLLDVSSGVPISNNVVESVERKLQQQPLSNIKQNANSLANFKGDIENEEVKEVQEIVEIPEVVDITDTKEEEDKVVESLVESKTLYERIKEGTKYYVLTPFRWLTNLFSSIVEFMKRNSSKFMFFFLQNIICVVVVMVALSLVGLSAAEFGLQFLIYLFFANAYTSLKEIVKFIYRHVAFQLGIRERGASYIQSILGTFKSFFGWALQWIAGWMPIPFLRKAVGFFKIIFEKGFDFFFTQVLAKFDFITAIRTRDFSTFLPFLTDIVVKMHNFFLNPGEWASKLVNGDISINVIYFVIQFIYDILCGTGDEESEGFVCGAFKIFLRIINMYAWFNLIQGALADMYFYIDLRAYFSYNATDQYKLKKFVDNHQKEYASPCGNFMNGLFFGKQPQQKYDDEAEAENPSDPDPTAPPGFTGSEPIREPIKNILSKHDRQHQTNLLNEAEKFTKLIKKDFPETWQSWTFHRKNIEQIENKTGVQFPNLKDNPAFRHVESVTLGAFDANYVVQPTYGRHAVEKSLEQLDIGIQDQFDREFAFIYQDRELSKELYSDKYNGNIVIMAKEKYPDQYTKITKTPESRFRRLYDWWTGRERIEAP